MTGILEKANILFLHRLYARFRTLVRCRDEHLGSHLTLAEILQSIARCISPGCMRRRNRELETQLIKHNVPVLCPVVSRSRGYLAQIVIISPSMV